jgi:L-fuculose-phosphate aldolase
VQDATLTAIKLNEIAEVNYRARLLGEPQPISDEDIKSFLPTHERMKASGAYVESAWRYYCTLLDEPVISPGSDKSSRG